MARGKKTGGRQPGAPNKVTASMKDWIQQLIDGNRNQLEADLKALDPKERWQVIEKLMTYTIPKMQSVDAKVDLNNLSDNQLDHIINEITKSINDENASD